MSPTVARTTYGNSKIWQHRLFYTVVAALLVGTMYLLLYMVGLVPENFRYSAVDTQQTPAVATAPTTSLSELEDAVTMPTNERARRVVIPALGINRVIKNPVTTDTQTLNNYLAEGAVRWPESGNPGQGNLFLFGHSTSFETVFNQAYKTFNGIETLSEGEAIQIETASGIYTYRVISVEMKRDADIYIPFDSESDMLTLATCNTLGQKEDRFVVRARLADYQPRN